MKSSFTLLLLCFMAVYQQAKAQTEPPMIGRPDGHEPAGEVNADKPLLGRPDGHEPGSEAKAKPGLLGRPDGHEPGSEEDASDERDAGQPLLGRPDGHEPGTESESEDADEDGSDEVPDEDAEDEEDNDSDTDDYDTLEDLIYPEEQLPTENEDGEKPLVRCKRPLCLMYCENGFQTDASGCPVCHCAEPDRSLIGRPDGHEPVASNCSDRPMCAMFCKNGFKNGDDGCPICECSDTSDKSVQGHQEGSEPASVCGDQPLCRMYCRLGFQTDERGCPVCFCLEDPCQGVVCESGSECQSQACEDSKSCKQLSAKCVLWESLLCNPNGGMFTSCRGAISTGQSRHTAIATPKSAPCPEPMCANACPYGYMKNEAGCMTCVCDSVPAERVCGPINCDEGLICRNSTDGSLPKCSIKTICETRQSQPVALGGASLLCERDGSFKPLQCNPKQAECWCVDGLGQEVKDTRSTVYVDEHKPKCPRNITVSMHLHMTLIVKHDIDVSNELGSLNATIVDHVSSWLLIEPHYIKVAKAEAVSSDSYDDENDMSDDTDTDAYYKGSEDTDELDSSRRLIVELVVMHDGQSDLPSAANYMQRRMHMGLCDIPVGKGSLLPNPYTLKTEHQFAHQPVFPDEVAELDDEISWSCWKGVRVGLCALGTGLCILVVATVVLALIRRRRMRSVQFMHQRLDSQISVEKDLLKEESEKSMPSDHDAYMTKDEKHPIA